MGIIKQSSMGANLKTISNYAKMKERERMHNAVKKFTSTENVQEETAAMHAARLISKKEALWSKMCPSCDSIVNFSKNRTSVVCPRCLYVFNSHDINNSRKATPESEYDVPIQNRPTFSCPTCGKKSQYSSYGITISCEECGQRYITTSRGPQKISPVCAGRVRYSERNRTTLREGEITCTSCHVTFNPDNIHKYKGIRSTTTYQCPSCQTIREYVIKQGPIRCARCGGPLNWRDEVIKINQATSAERYIPTGESTEKMLNTMSIGEIDKLTAGTRVRIKIPSTGNTEHGLIRRIIYPNGKSSIQILIKRTDGTKQQYIRSNITRLNLRIMVGSRDIGTAKGLAYMLRKKLFYIL